MTSSMERLALACIIAHGADSCERFYDVLGEHPMPRAQRDMIATVAARHAETPAEYQVLTFTILHYSSERGFPTVDPKLGLHGSFDGCVMLRPATSPTCVAGEALGALCEIGDPDAVLGAVLARAGFLALERELSDGRRFYVWVLPNDSELGKELYDAQQG